MSLWVVGAITVVVFAAYGVALVAIVRLDARRAPHK